MDDLISEHIWRIVVFVCIFIASYYLYDKKNVETAENYTPNDNYDDCDGIH